MKKLFMFASVLFLSLSMNSCGEETTEDKMDDAKDSKEETGEDMKDAVNLLLKTLEIKLWR